MPLTLVTGPANAAKAGVVLGALRDRLDEEPILVVPSYDDLDHSRRELAERGAVFGARVMLFGGLFDELARRAGVGGRTASDLQRELLVEAAVHSAGLDVLASSAAQAGFVAAAARFVRELGVVMVDPARLAGALRRWAGDGPRRRYAEEVAAIVRGYRDGLAEAGLTDPELRARAALDALRREPDRFGRTPVLLYGFDDFTRLELDALETLARRCGAPVTVSLPFEAGREAFRTVAGVYGELAALADERVELDAVPDHYAPASHRALHHLERRLFEEQPGERAPAGGALRLHSAGGERAEVELAAASVLELLRSGTAPGEVALVFRDPARYASLVESVFDAYGIPFSVDRHVRFPHTGLGRGLLALLRASLPDGRAEDLLAWLRTPGKLRVPALADELESQVRRRGALSARAAQEIWEESRFGLDELDRLRAARGVDALLAELERALDALFAAPWRRGAPILSGPELGDARAYTRAREALSALRAVAGTPAGRRLDAARVARTLEELRVRAGEPAQPDRVQVAAPEAVRARRFEAVFVLGLQEGEFPRRSAPEPFLPDEERRALARASGLVLPLREDELARERYLFYVCASRAERLLVLSSRVCDEEGEPQSASFFVEDAAELFEPPERRVRSLSDVSWELEAAPTAAELERALARRGPRRHGREPEPLRSAAVLTRLAQRDAVSARALEDFADCPVKWFVDDLLAPDALEPDPEAMVRGRYAHAVLEATYARLPAETGSAAVTPATLEHAERILLEELSGQSSEFRLSPRQTRVRAALRRLEFELLRHLRHEARRSSRFEPYRLELRFGMDDEPLEAGGVRVRGVIDRVDRWDGYALVRDYKTGRDVSSYKVGSWERKNRFQAALYMVAVERLLGLRPAGGVYVPLGGTDRRPRGLVAEELRPALGDDFHERDAKPADEFEDHLGRALATVSEVAGRMRRGELRACPDSCAFRGGCAHPSICRTEA